MNVYQGYSKKSIKPSLLALTLLVFLAGCGSGGGGGSDSSNGSGGNGGGNGGSGPVDNIKPSVTSMSPADDVTGVGSNIKVTATFSEAMDPTLINTDNFRLSDGADPATQVVRYLPGTVRFDASNHVATFMPTVALTPGQRYTATIVTGIKDPAGNQITKDFAWCFVIGSTADATPPSVASTIPSNSSASVPINSKIVARFSEDMNSLILTTTSFTLTGPGGTVAGTVNYLDKTAVFTPSSSLTANATYTATLTSAATDVVGNPLPTSTWSFTTGASADSAAPVVNSTSPANAATGVAIGSTIRVVFNEPMDPFTITTANLSVTQPGVPEPTPVIGTVSYDMSSNTAIFTRINHLVTPGEPHAIQVSNLDPNITYTVTLNPGATDLAGNPVASKVWSFTTAP